MTWPDTPQPDDGGPAARLPRRAQLSVVPPQAPPAEEEDGRDGPPVADPCPGAHDGALFDWARQLPEWSADAAPPRAARPPRQAAPLSAPSSRPAAVPPSLPAAVPAPRPAPVLSAAAELWKERLTHRGRVVVGAAVSVLATALLAGLLLDVGTAGASAVGSAPAESALREGEPSTVVVRDGDTLWSIAERVRPGDDPRSTVHEIVRVNGLSESEIEPGQELVMPES
ncbi:LysM peptidoglycan-binding domain-containing protein [Streptomonospora wellingtoniae]|uniref:LysM peptidoglycan-binding domain-containing protein n=1 Tax=Streptomonospora wellingtoniae TaxID=3075544 RepID=A0ABU2KZM9_9ACTN|nr:LysM peptidoglycan-binding domain-containing protein [Streptomonospora sp. DSM 45055]MDT0304713.1 LysM peptidoglycan-binding domain-containing protein [Streptomonospora sp. DSM 45055]